MYSQGGASQPLDQQQLRTSIGTFGPTNEELVLDMLGAQADSKFVSQQQPSVSASQAGVFDFGMNINDLSHQFLTNTQSQQQQQQQLMQQSQQYESVMQMMHQEIQRLMLENQHLSTMAMVAQSAAKATQPLPSDPSSPSQRGQTVQPQSAFNFAGGKTANNEELAELRKKVFEKEQEIEKMKSEVRHLQGINDDLNQELQSSRVKREEIDNMLQDAKSTICQQMIQVRSLKSALDLQAIESAGMQSQIRREAMLTEQSVAETQRLRSLLEENDAIKIQQMQLLDATEREVQALRGIIRRLMNVITTHREEFGDLADLDYDLMIKDVSNVNLQYQSPSTTHAQFLSQLLNSESINRQPHDIQAEYIASENPYVPPMLNNLQRGEDYQSIIDKYNRHFQQQKINNPPPGSQIRNDSARQSYQQTPLEQTNYGHTNSNPNTRNASEPAKPQSVSSSINWVSGGVGLQPPQRQSQPSSERGGGGQGRKAPNVDALKATLASLNEEKARLEDKIKRAPNNAAREEYQFELDVATSNIRHVQDKLSQAGVAFI